MSESCHTSADVLTNRSSNTHNNQSGHISLYVRPLIRTRVHAVTVQGGEDPKMPYLYTPFSGKEPYDYLLFCKKTSTT